MSEKAPRLAKKLPGGSKSLHSCKKNSFRLIENHVFGMIDPISKLTVMATIATTFIFVHSHICICLSDSCIFAKHCLSGKLCVYSIAKINLQILHLNYFHQYIMLSVLKCYIHISFSFVNQKGDILRLNASYSLSIYQPQNIILFLDSNTHTHKVYSKRFSYVLMEKLIIYTLVFCAECLKLMCVIHTHILRLRWFFDRRHIA